MEDAAVPLQQKLRQAADDAFRAVMTNFVAAEEPLPASADDATADKKDVGNESRPAASTLMLADNRCASDLSRFCKPEAEVLALLREVKDSVSPAKLDVAMRNVHLCMAQHADELSPGCVETLVTEIIGEPSASASASPALSAASVPASAAPVDEDSSVEINIYYSKHHRGEPHALRSDGAFSSLGMSGTSGDIGHPFLWLLVLPFFLVGMYVTVKHGIVYARRRREERRIECKQQYLPVP